MNNSKNKKLIFIYTSIYLIFLINIILNIKSLYLWNDESFTFHLIHHGFSNIMDLTSQDVHPFLYYFIAKVGISPFNSKFLQISILRFISAIPYLILLIIGNTTIKHYFSTKVSLLFMFSVITMPLLVQNIYQVRMYGWALLFTTIVFLLLDYIYKGIKANSYGSFIWVSVFSLLAAYTHYYALIAVAIMYGLFLIVFLAKRKKVRYLIVSIIIDLLLYLPWMRILLKQTQSVSKDYWTPAMNFKYIAKTVLSLVSPDSNKKIFFIFSFIIIFIIAYVIVKTFNTKLLVSYIGLSIPFIVIIIGAILSLFVGHTVLVLRYLTPVMGIFWLSISVLVDKLLSKINLSKLSKLVVVSLIILLGMGSYLENMHQVHKYDTQFNETLQIYKKIPKNARIIYDNSVVMYSSSSYLNHNYVLNHRNNDVLFGIYHKVFNNIKGKNSYALSKCKPVYFIRAGKQAKAGLKQYDSRMSNHFYNKYKNRMIKKGNVYLPLDGGKSAVYEIK